MSIFSKFLNAFKSIRLNDKHGLTGLQLDHVLASAMYAEQQSAFLNSYQTGLNQVDIKKLAESYWDIFNRADSVEILEDLLRRNDDVYIDVVYTAIESQTDYVAILKSGLPANDEAFKYYLDLYRNLSRVIAELIKENVIKDFAEVKKIKDSAWNFGRGSFLSRCFYELDYISEQEMKQYLEKYYIGLKKYCSTWKEYTTSYIFGRATWGGPNNMGMVQIADSLLNNEKSPMKGKTFL